MKIYTFGAEDAPVLLLLPGTCCHWKSNFGAVIPLLADSFRVLCVNYDGFDETEQTEFPTMLHTQNPACVCEISVIFFVFRYTLGLPQAPRLSWGGLTMYKQAEAEQNNAKPRDCG